MAAYDRYFAGDLVDHAYSQDAVNEAMKRLPKVGAA
jgi:hypothetical protein